MAFIDKLNMAPKKPKNLFATRQKIVYFLVAILILFGCVKATNIYALSRAVVNVNAAFLLSQVKDASDTDALNKSFAAEPFCGWQITKADGTVSSSPDFQNTVKTGEVVKRDYESNSFVLCIKVFKDIRATLIRQVVFILFIGCLTLFMIKITLNTPKETEIKDEGSEKVSNT